MNRQEPQTYSTSSPHQVCYWSLFIYIISYKSERGFRSQAAFFFFFFLLQSWFCESNQMLFMLIMEGIGWSDLIAY